MPKPKSHNSIPILRMRTKQKIKHQNLNSETCARAAEYTFIGSDCKQRLPNHIIQVKWNRPAAGWFKLNSDGSSLGNLGHAGGGGIIRNADGEWVTGWLVMPEL